MKDILKRDTTTGECIGECRDRVREGQEARQMEIASVAQNFKLEEIEFYPTINSAYSRNEPPGCWGGHM